MMSKVEQNSMKYYKYDLLNKTGIKTVLLESTRGMPDVAVSTSNRNPRNSPLNLGSCEPREGNKLADADRHWQLDELESSTFCNATTTGGCTKPRFVTNDEFGEEGMISYAKMCSSRWLYVSIERFNKTNAFNLTLFKDLVRTIDKTDQEVGLVLFHH